MDKKCSSCTGMPQAPIDDRESLYRINWDAYIGEQLKVISTAAPCALRHNQLAERMGGFPFSVLELSQALRHAYVYCVSGVQLGRDTWTIIFIGTPEECLSEMRKIMEIKGL